MELLNKWWYLVHLPKVPRTFPCKWVLKMLTSSSLPEQKAWLVMKGYKQEYRVDFNENLISRPQISTRNSRVGATNESNNHNLLCGSCNGIFAYCLSRVWRAAYPRESQAHGTFYKETLAQWAMYLFSISQGTFWFWFHYSSLSDDHFSFIKVGWQICINWGWL